MLRTTEMIKATTQKESVLMSDDLISYYESEFKKIIKQIDDAEPLFCSRYTDVVKEGVACLPNPTKPEEKLEWAKRKYHMAKEILETLRRDLDAECEVCRTISDATSFSYGERGESWVHHGSFTKTRMGEEQGFGPDLHERGMGDRFHSVCQRRSCFRPSETEALRRQVRLYCAIK